MTKKEKKLNMIRFNIKKDKLMNFLQMTLPVNGEKKSNQFETRLEPYHD